MAGLTGTLVRVVLVGALALPFAGPASALTAKHLRGNQRRHFASRHHYRQYGNPAVSRAVAGAALGIIGLAAGAAAANAYDGYDDGPGYGYGYAPQYAYPSYGYGYAPY